MPRTGGVFSLLSGSKGTPNTTIQSAPYNAQLDDFAQDANLARPITAGGTGATNASAARTNLGLAVGADVQAYDAGLQSIAGLTTSANLMIYTTAADAYATTALTPFARTILDDADAATVRGTLGLGSLATLSTAPVANGGTGATTAAAARTNLGVAIGSNVQAYDAGLQSISALTTAADTMIYTTALDAYATTALTPFARTLLDDADAPTVRGTLGLKALAVLDTVNDSNWSGTDLSVANGGTGGSTAAAARTNLDVYSKGEIETAFRAALTGYISPGFNLSNNATDAANDLNFPTGVVASSAATPILMPHTAGTAQLDVAWNTGTGGRFDSAISDGWWHCFIISNGISVNRGFSKSLDPTSQPNYPSGYTHYRRVASWPRVSGALATLTQREDHFDYGPTSVVTERNSTAGQGATLLTLSVPTGIVVQPKLYSAQQQSATGNIQTFFSTIGSSSPSRVTTIESQEVGSIFLDGGGMFTDTAARVTFRVDILSGSLVFNILKTLGWIDERGRA